MKIGIFYDTFMTRGGAERTISILANHFKADIVTSGYDPGLLKDWVHTNLVDIGNLTFNIDFRLGFLESTLRFYKNRNNFDYDLFIFSGIYSIFAAYDNVPNIWFCHTPDRILYDPNLREFIMDYISIVKKPIWTSYIKFFYPVLLLLFCPGTVYSTFW